MSTAAFLLTGAGAAVVIAKRHRLAAQIAKPDHRDLDHSPFWVLFLPGLAVLGVNFVLDGASDLSDFGQYWFTSARPQLVKYFASPSVSMAIGVLLFFLQPIIAHSLAPGRED